MVQMKRIETMQTTAAMRSKRLTNLDAATQGEDINPMAPHFDTEPESSQSVPFGKPRPRPRIATNAVTSQPSPTFSLAAPNQAFGFKLSNTGQATTSNNNEVSLGTSRASSFFTGGSPATRASTAPTSRAGSICSSSQRELGASQQRHSHGLSSRLKILARASQSGVEAPARLSRVPSATAAHPLPGQPPLSNSQQGKLLVIFFSFSHVHSSHSELPVGRAG